MVFKETIHFHYFYIDFLKIKCLFLDTIYTSFMTQGIAISNTLYMMLSFQFYCNIVWRKWKYWQRDNYIIHVKIIFCKITFCTYIAITLCTFELLWMYIVKKVIFAYEFFISPKLVSSSSRIGTFAKDLLFYCHHTSFFQLIK